MFNRIIAIVIALIIGGSQMAYLNEVNGKVRTKTIEIGDGYDGVHSPLQVNPRMASNMLNCSPDLFPSLSVRSGRTQLAYFTKNIALYESIYGFVKPYVDSSGNTHFAFLLHDTNADELRMERYVLKAGLYYPEKVSGVVLSVSINMNIFEAQRYLNVNFIEANGMVYLNYINFIGGYTMEYYEIGTNNIWQEVLTVDDSINASPSAVYLNKMFIATGYPNQTGNTENIYSLAYSKTGVFKDFTTAVNSGKIALHQGGKITCIIPMRDRLFIGTETALFLLFGNGFDSFSLSLLADNIGVKNVNSVVSKNGVVYFISNTNDVYEYNGGSLVNISREPIDTGSRSAVQGGYLENTLNFQSMSIEKSNLRCRNDNGYSYLFDTVKRRWYIQDGLSSSVFFNSLTNAYELTSDITDMTTYYKLDMSIYDIDNDTNQNTYITKITNGTAQVVSLTVVGTLTQSNAATMNFSDSYSDRIFSYTNLSGSTTATNVATQFRNQLISAYQYNKMYTVGGTGATITLTKNQPLPSDADIVWNISGAGLTTTNYTTTTAGVAPTFSSATTQSNPLFSWTSAAFQLNPTGKQVLKAIHVTYYAPIGTSLSLSTSKTVDQEDFILESNLKNSALKQNSRKTMFIKDATFQDWLRIRFNGQGNVIIYNITLEWRILDRMA